MKILRLGQSLCSSNGGGGTETRFVFSVDTTIAGSTGTGKFEVPIVSGQGANCDIDWGDGNTNTGVTAAITHTYSSSGTYTIKIDGTLKGMQFNNGGDKLKLKEISNWGIFEFTRTSVFYGCTNMTCTATDVPKTIGANMQFTFSGCANFNGPSLGQWDMSGTNSIRDMFRGCTVFNQLLNSWDTSSVTTMRQTFRDADAYNQRMSGWDTSSVTDMFAMFRSADSFNQDVNTWDVSNVLTMDNMFRDADAFDKSLSDWDVSSVTSITNFMSTKTPSTYSSANLAALYTGWAAHTVTSSLGISFGTAEYDSSGAAGRTTLTTTYSWSITDGGQA